MDDHVARLDEGQQQRRDRRHAAREGQRVLGVFPQLQPVLEDFLVGPVEARIDQALGAARALAGDAFEEALAVRRGLEHEGRGEEDRRLQRAFAERRVEAVAHHQGRRAELVVADGSRRRLGLAGRGRAAELGFILVGHGALPRPINAAISHTIPTISGTPARSSSKPALSIRGSAMWPVAQAIALGPVPDGSMKPQLAAQAAGRASRIGSMPVAAMIPATTGMIPLAAATLVANSVITMTIATSDDGDDQRVDGAQRLQRGAEPVAEARCAHARGERQAAAEQHDHAPRRAVGFLPVEDRAGRCRRG